MGKKILFESTENKELGPSEEAKRKKMVLDDVIQSFLPVEEAVKKWNISVSTYYRWRRRYEKSGLAGLKGMSEEKIEETSEEHREEEFGMEEERREDIIHEEEKSAEEKAGEVTEEHRKEEFETEEEKKEEAKVELKEPAPPSPPKGGGFGLGMPLVVIGGILGILLFLSMFNASTFYIKQDGNEITLWRGKFSPFSKERTRVKDVKPIVLPKVDLGKLTENSYGTRYDAVNAIFNLTLEKADEQLKEHSQPGLSEANKLLEAAKNLPITADKQEALNIRISKLEYLMAVDKTIRGKNMMIQMYNEALAHLQKAKEHGFEDTKKIEAKIKEIEEWLKRLIAKPKEVQEGS